LEEEWRSKVKVGMQGKLIRGTTAETSARRLGSSETRHLLLLIFKTGLRKKDEEVKER
jgi:hypothetical protein